MEALTLQALSALRPFLVVLTNQEEWEKAGLRVTDLARVRVGKTRGPNYSTIAVEHVRLESVSDGEVEIRTRFEVDVYYPELGRSQSDEVCREPAKVARRVLRQIAEVVAAGQAKKRSYNEGHV